VTETIWATFPEITSPAVVCSESGKTTEEGNLQVRWLGSKFRKNNKDIPVQGLGSQLVQLQDLLVR
jgi:hypothetical protein